MHSSSKCLSLNSLVSKTQKTVKRDSKISVSRNVMVVLGSSLGIVKGEVPAVVSGKHCKDKEEKCN